MHDPKKPPEPGESPTPTPEAHAGGFGAFAEVDRARWAANQPSMRRREAAETTGAMPQASPPSNSSATRPRAENGPRWFRPPVAIVMDRATLPGDFVDADGLPLERLYARFDAIARGREPGNSSAAHQSLIVRLASNQRRAEARGWTGCVLERAGGSGRLELRGTPPSGRDREIVPDAIPDDRPEPTTGSNGPNAASDLPHDDEDGIGTDLTNPSSRSRMRWLDDGGR
jgi:hypothetical protein